MGDSAAWGVVVLASEKAMVWGPALALASEAMQRSSELDIFICSAALSACECGGFPGPLISLLEAVRLDCEGALGQLSGATWVARRLGVGPLPSVSLSVPVPVSSSARCPRGCSCRAVSS